MKLKSIMFMLFMLLSCTALAYAIQNEPILKRNEVKTLVVGEPWYLEDGYALTAKQVDLDGAKVWLSLSKDGVEIDSEVVKAGSRYYYTTEVDGIERTIFRTTVDALFRGTKANMIQLKDTYLYSDDAPGPIPDITSREYEPIKETKTFRETENFREKQSSPFTSKYVIIGIIVAVALYIYLVIYWKLE
ncbi:MAG: S-layer protein domain-containing protein [Methanosarcinales archaeon]